MVRSFLDVQTRLSVMTVWTAKVSHSCIVQLILVDARPLTKWFLKVWGLGECGNGLHQFLVHPLNMLHGSELGDNAMLGKQVE